MQIALPMVQMTGSYQLVSDVSPNRPSTDLFSQGWGGVEGSGDLDDWMSATADSM
jgi:hypothetical protein